MPWKPVPGGTRIAVKVTPKARASGVEGLAAGADGAMSLVVKVRAAPDKGAANKEVIEVLARALDLPRGALSLVSGETSRQKVIQAAAVPERIAAFVESLRGRT